MWKPETIDLDKPLYIAIVEEMEKDIARGILKAGEKLANYTYYGSSTSYFVWLKLPEHWTAKEFEAKALESGVNVFCADKFIVGSETAPNAVRLSLTGAGDIKELEAGLDILKNLLEQTYMGINAFI